MTPEMIQKVLWAIHRASAQIDNALLPLFSCGPTEAEKHQSFVATCVPAFTKAQCEVLYGVKKSSDQAKDQASFAAAMSGASLAFSGAASGRK